MRETALLLRHVRLAGELVDLHIEAGRIVAIAPRLSLKIPQFNGDGATIIPGLHDHHIHLLAMAADFGTVQVGPVEAPNVEAFTSRLKAAARVGEGWIRAAGYHESTAGPLDRDLLDAILPSRPLRVQYRTGSLWALNSCALQEVLAHVDAPPALDFDAAGRPTGRFWRMDAWLRTRWPRPLIDLHKVGRLLASYGVTGLTDTSVSTGPEDASVLANAVRTGSLPQSLTLMSGNELVAPADGAFAVGAVKIILDDQALGDLAPVLEKIRNARSWGRPVAFHCVTNDELSFALAAFGETGSVSGDRIEHGGVIHPAQADAIAAERLTVVTQPSFIAERGDIYRREVAVEDIGALYPCASLLRRGIRVGGSTDAPYTSPDPWRAMAAAIDRRTRSGFTMGDAERVSPSVALSLFLGQADDPGGSSRRIAVGEKADACLIDGDLNVPSAQMVRATICAGRIVYDSAGHL